jgi:hypothetical protein
VVFAMELTYSTYLKLQKDVDGAIHMRAFDATGARPYCDHPSALNAVLEDLEERREEFSRRRTAAVELLTCTPRPILGSPAGPGLELGRPILEARGGA